MGPLACLWHPLELSTNPIARVISVTGLQEVPHPTGTKDLYMVGDEPKDEAVLILGRGTVCCIVDKVEHVVVSIRRLQEWKKVSLVEQLQNGNYHSAIVSVYRRQVNETRMVNTWLVGNHVMDDDRVYSDYVLQPMGTLYNSRRLLACVILRKVELNHNPRIEEVQFDDTELSKLCFDLLHMCTELVEFGDEDFF